MLELYRFQNSNLVSDTPLLQPLWASTALAEKPNCAKNENLNNMLLRCIAEITDEHGSRYAYKTHYNIVHLHHTDVIKKALRHSAL